MTTTTIVLIVVFAIGAWALVRWHYQCLMRDRLLRLQTIHTWMDDDPDMAKMRLEWFINAQYNQLEYYLRHPANIDPTMPESIVNRNLQLTILPDMRLSIPFPDVIKQHHDFRAKIGMDNNTHDLDENPE